MSCMESMARTPTTIKTCWMAAVGRGSITRTATRGSIGSAIGYAAPPSARQLRDALPLQPAPRWPLLLPPLRALLPQRPPRLAGSLAALGGKLTCWLWAQIGRRYRHRRCCQARQARPARLLSHLESNAYAPVSLAAETTANRRRRSRAIVQLGLTSSARGVAFLLWSRSHVLRRSMQRDQASVPMMLEGKLFFTTRRCRCSA
jgi:hypothetical protein